MRLAVYLLLAMFSCLFFGCDDGAIAVAGNDGSSDGNKAPVHQENAPADASDDEGGIGKAVSDLVGKARENAPTLDGTRKWLNEAGDATGQTAEDTMDWINETYKSLSDQGLTTAKNAQEWVSQDWNSMGAWEYKVLELATNGNPKQAEEKLNEAGKFRWECYHVTDLPGGMRFFMKRQKRSYLKNVPLKDMLKLIPLLDNSSEE